MERNEQSIQQDVDSLFLEIADSMKLSDAFFGPSGLFARIGRTKEERISISASRVFRDAQERIVSRQRAQSGTLALTTNAAVTAIGAYRASQLAAQGRAIIGAPLVLALIARQRRRIATRRAEGNSSLVESTLWDLALPDGNLVVDLPREVAEHCYGLGQHSVAMRLHSSNLENNPKGLRLQMEITPGPPKAPFTAIVCLANGDWIDFQVSVTRNGRKAMAAASNPVPIAALRPTNGHTVLAILLEMDKSL